MTGMKEGAGEDPFADDTVAKESETESTESPTQTPTEGTETSDNVAAKESAEPSQSQVQIPYKYRRDSVQDGRDRVPLFLQPETKTNEREVLRELEERFDDDISLTDLREALVKVGLEHIGEAEDCLEEWGYGMTFD